MMHNTYYFVHERIHMSIKENVVHVDELMTAYEAYSLQFDRVSHMFGLLMEPRVGKYDLGIFNPDGRLLYPKEVFHVLAKVDNTTLVDFIVPKKEWDTHQIELPDAMAAI